LIHWRSSTDLLKWTRNGAVFSAMPAWASEAVPGTRGIWAPDISYVNGEFRLYYSVSRFGENTSAIGLAVTKTLARSDPRFGWLDEGLVVRSDSRDDFNAIDPDLLVDASGRHWLSFGSFWTGIKLIELDPATGKPTRDHPTMYSVARRSSPGAIEAPKMIAHGGWFYLFASFEYCCRGVNSTYYTVVGRAESPTGPFRDAEGRSMNEGGGSIVLRADQDPTRRWIGPGHPAILSVGQGDFIAYHAYDREAAGRPTLRIQRLGWTSDGWPVAQ
jgi:arabinan endo-1,5-alpha-L-arabinosidase